MLENLEGEEWRDIEDYEGSYTVSNKGHVKSLKLDKEKILKPGTYSKYGHQFVVLCKNGITTNKSVHRLVAEAFLPNPENKPCVDHVNTDPTDNCVDNLRWTTHKENHQNPLSLIHYRDAIRNKMISVYCFETDTTYQSALDVERQLNVYHSNVNKCCRGKRKSAGGYHFCYADEMKKEE